MFNNERLNTAVYDNLPTEFVKTSASTTDYFKKGMCILVSDKWKSNGGLSSGCTPVYESGKVLNDAKDGLEDVEKATDFNMFDYYAVSNGDAFNTPHNPGFPGTDNAYITA